MRKFLISVNGTRYEVDVEEVIGGAYAPAQVAVPSASVAAPVAAPAAPAQPAPVPKQEEKPAAATSSKAPAGSETINSPMPGTIVAVNVAVGNAVKKGDVLVILEAMKMENEILAPRNGTVAAVSVTKGSTVNSGDVLVAIQ